MKAEYGRVPASDLKMLWFDNWWDGPLSGMCEFDGERLHFSMVGEDQGTRQRTYGLYRMTAEQLEAVEYWHEEFCKYVGTHWDADFGSAGLFRGEPTVRDEPAMFYERYKLVSDQMRPENYVKVGEFGDE